MQNKLLTHGYRLLLGLLGVAAIITDIVHGLSSIPGFSVVNYFSFFTVLSTTLASLTLLYVALRKDIPMLRGAATLFMVITGVIYFIMLRDLPIQIFWVNAVFHYVLPLALLVDWLTHLPKKPASVGMTGLWLLFPVIFLLYTLVRGAILNWYPYPFLNVSTFGYGEVLRNVVMVGVGMIILGGIVGQAPRLYGIFGHKKA